MCLNQKLIGKQYNGVSNDYIPGDVIKFKRSFYSHYALYIGDGKVIHKDNASFIKPRSVVRIEKMGSIPGIPEIANDEYKFMKELPYDKTIENAKLQLGRSNYNVIFDNCEHFVTEIKYNRRISKQVRNIQLTVMTLISMLLYWYN